MDKYWDAPSVHHHPIKYESENGVNYPYCASSENGGHGYGNAALTFSEDDAEFVPKRVKPTRQDPLSHRIIEKRRRDRMNSCLADLSRLIPAQYQRKSRGRIEKTEIIEMAIKHIKNIQAKAAAVDNGGGAGASGPGSAESSSAVAAAARQCFQVDQYREGYQECLATAVQFLIELSAHFEEICFKMVNHLKEHFNDVVKGDHCPNSSTGYQMKRRQQENGSPPTTTSTGPLNGLGQFLLANGMAMTEGRAGGLAAPGGLNGMGPRLAHLCGSINGHSSTGTNGAASGGLKNGSCAGSSCEGVPSSSDGQEMNCAKDLSCRASQNSSASASGNKGTMCNGDLSKDGASGLGGGCRKAPQQTPVITSTASTSVAADLLVHAETESSSSALDHGCVLEASAGASMGGGLGGGSGGPASHLVKVHNLTDTSCDGVEHHYKYKNYMQQRFSHERYHDEHVVSNSSNELHDHHDHAMQDSSTGGGVGGAGGATVPTVANVGGGSSRGSMAPPPVDPTDSNCSVDTFVAFNAKRTAMEALKRDREELPAASILLREYNQAAAAAAAAAIKEEKMDTSPSPVGTCEVAPRMIEGSQQMPRMKAKAKIPSVPVPIFALHSHGAFYIPLTVDYDALVPYLGAVNLLDKGLTAAKALHPVNISIYAPF